MTLQDHLNAAFDSAVQVEAANLVVGDRAPIRVLLSEGITLGNERRPGRFHGSWTARVTATKRDLGELPVAGERATLDYADKTYAGAITDEDISLDGGAFVSFTISNR